MKKILTFLFIIMMLIVPIQAYAVTTTVTNETELQAALNDATVDTIVVANDIVVTNTIVLPDDSRTINIQAQNATTIRANGVDFLFDYTTPNNNLVLNFNNITTDGVQTSGIVYINAQTGSLTLNQLNAINGRDAQRAEGGAIYKQSGTLNLNDSTIDNSIVGGSGGAIYNNSGDTNIRNTSFTNQNSGAEGGAIYNNSGNLVIQDSNFDNNGTGGSGGAIFNTANGSLSVTNSQFTNNGAGYSGGAISSQGSTQINTTNFNTNNAGAIGAAIYGNNTNLTITNSDFTNHFPGAEGGAIYTEGSTVTINGGSFANNSAVTGGAIYNNNGTYTIEDTIFTNNNAMQGGAIYSNGIVNIRGASRFEFNFADSGGAIYITRLPDLFIDSGNQTVVFNANQAVRETSIEGNDELIALHNSQVVGNYTTSITPYLYNNYDVNFEAYLLKYDPNAQDPVQNLPKEVYYQEGQQAIISNQVPERIGYTFVGWNTSPDGSGALYYPGDSFLMPNGDVTLYAQWQPNPVELIYDPNTADPVQNLPLAESYLPGEVATISEQIPTRAGYTFAGWNTSPDGSGTVYQPGDTLVVPEDGLTLYAQWDAIEYNLNFSPNTTDPVENIPSDIRYQTGEQVTIPNQIPTRAGYTFTGWNTRPDGLGTTYQPGDIFTGFDADQTLYAQWQQDNTPIIIIIIVTILFVLLAISTLIIQLCNRTCKCNCHKK